MEEIMAFRCNYLPNPLGKTFGLEHVSAGSQTFDRLEKPLGVTLTLAGEAVALL